MPFLIRLPELGDTAKRAKHALVTCVQAVATRYSGEALALSPSADTNGGGQTMVCKIALHKKM